MRVASTSNNIIESCHQEARDFIRCINLSCAFSRVICRRSVAHFWLSVSVSSAALNMASRRVSASSIATVLDLLVKKSDSTREQLYHDRPACFKAAQRPSAWPTAMRFRSSVWADAKISVQTSGRCVINYKLLLSSIIIV